MDIRVTADSAVPARGQLVCGDKTFTCALGHAGVSATKTESDGKTPTGRFPLRRVLYRADRLNAPQTALPIQPLSPNDGWCDAPADPAYNQLITHPYPASAEHLWRADDLYNVIVVLGHNDDPVVPGAGSAIFLHVATEDFTPTEGCVAVAQSDLLAVLKRCTDRSWMTIEEPKS